MLEKIIPGLKKYRSWKEEKLNQRYHSESEFIKKQIKNGADGVPPSGYRLSELEHNLEIVLELENRDRQYHEGVNEIYKPLRYILALTVGFMGLMVYGHCSGDNVPQTPSQNTVQHEQVIDKTMSTSSKLEGFEYVLKQHIPKN